jgi:ribosomal protein S20
MIKRKIQKIEFILEDRDIQTILNALQYVYHRMKRHEKCQFISKEDVKRLLEEFEKGYTY